MERNANRLVRLDDLTGRRFGRLTVICLDHRRNGRSYWYCQCRCGNATVARADCLKNRSIRSCGCYHREVFLRSGYIHKPGTRFSRLVVIKTIGRDKEHGRIYLCRCDCGNKVHVQGRYLRSGESTSCGCRYDETRETKLRHGYCRSKHKTPEYRAYQHARTVCLNPKNPGFYFVGNRGVEFRFANFEQFLDAVGPRPDDEHRLHRIDRDKDYEVGNVVWVKIRHHRRRDKPPIAHVAQSINTTL